MSGAAHSTGRLAVGHRHNFERHYDLPERVYPPEILALPTPPEDEAQQPSDLEPLGGYPGQARRVRQVIQLDGYTRLRSEHYGVPVVYLHSPYAASKSLGKWNPGTVMYDFFLDDLASSKR